MSTAMMTLKAVSPLALHQRRASEQFAPTLDYAPGSAVRGALADLYLAGDPQRANDTLFQQIFASEDVCFSDFFPTAGKGGDLTRLSPATAVACKRFDDHYGESLSDSLLRLELLREWETPDLEQLDAWRQCPECKSAGFDGKLDRAGPGYYVSVERHEPIKVRRRMIAGTAIERSTRTAAQAMLFSHEVIEESGALENQDVLFRGTVSVSDELHLALQAIAPLKQRLAVGYGRSRGLGQLQIENWGSPRAETKPLRERWEALNEAARKLWQTFGQTLKGQYFSLTLQSHLALRDEARQPVLGEITAAHLDLPEAERCRCVLSAVAVPGWNSALDMPKADTWALERGSVLLFRLPLDADPNPTLSRLETLEQDGAGERRAEGFGRMIACDPFHYHFTLRELKGGS
jgi:CRISPR-associated protein Csx10